MTTPNPSAATRPITRTDVMRAVDVAGLLDVPKSTVEELGAPRSRPEPQART
ncbi:MAG TPA: hypothetical protein VFT50_01450 [Baekduia sp.]|nr:hypothetical protein [Baekduia sp.]